VTFHIFATVLVFQGVIRKKPLYFIMAIIAHTAYNFIAVMVANIVGILASEAVLLILTIPAGIYIIKSRKGFQQPAIEQPSVTIAEN